MSTKTIICIANPDTTVGPEVTLYECPCRECWRMAQEANDDDTPRDLYRNWRADRLPDPTEGTR